MNVLMFKQIFAIGHIAAVFWAINSGYGRRLEAIEVPDREKLAKVHTMKRRKEVSLWLTFNPQALYISDIFYVATVGMTRISTAFFNSQLTRYLPQIRNSHILAGVSGLWTIAAIVALAVRKLPRPWEELDGVQNMVSPEIDDSLCDSYI
jgi:hypothetical protein